jgi:hypothetical protein
MMLPEIKDLIAQLLAIQSALDHTDGVGTPLQMVQIFTEEADRLSDAVEDWLYRRQLRAEEIPEDIR